MSNDLYLIAHKVRGESAFDIAQRMECPECNGKQIDDVEGESCIECDGYGWWWIIPTSGHRAYPWWHWALEATELNGNCNKNLIELAGSMPEGLPDHYPPRAETSAPKVSLLDRLNLRPTQPPIVRRI